MIMHGVIATIRNRLYNYLHSIINNMFFPSQCHCVHNTHTNIQLYHTQVHMQLLIAILEIKKDWCLDKGPCQWRKVLVP